jgi:hypothetical protein
MEGFFKGFTVQHIERAKNTEADKLAKAVARKACYHMMYFSTYQRFLRENS